MSEEYGIETVFDMEAHWLEFQDPEDPSKGVFYNCIIGWQCADINAVKLEAYGLDRWYNEVRPGSSDALEATLARAQQRHEPVFGYYFAPTSLMGAYDWVTLEEPVYTVECWSNVTAAAQDASRRPLDAACAYEDLPIEKLAHAGLLDKAPDVVEMLRKMVVGLEPINETLAWVAGDTVQSWDAAAVHYLQLYTDRWKGWVTPQAFTSIERALESGSP